MNGMAVALNDLGAQWAVGMRAAVWQSTVLALAVLLLSIGLRRASASFRLWLWMLVPLRLLIMPVLAVPVPVLPGPAPQLTAASVSSIPLIAPSPTGNETRRSSSVAPPEQTASPAQASPPTPVLATGIDGWTILMGVWILGMAVSGARLARVSRRVRHIMTRGEPITDRGIMEVAHAAAKMVGLPRIPPLLATAERISPFAWGVRRSIVVMPERLLRSADKGSLLAVLVHEFVHLRRKDSLMGVLLAVCETAYFFHPVVHLVRRRILLERERACDAHALAVSRGRPSAYARALVTAAELCRSNCMAPDPVVAPSTFEDLTARLLSIAAGLTPKPRLSRPALACLLGLAVLCLPGIVLTERSRPEPLIPHMQDAAPPPGFIGGGFAVSVPSMQRVALPAETRPQSTAQRTIQFPEDRSLGTLLVRTSPRPARYRLDPDYSAVSDWQYLGEARGTVAVPEGHIIRLEVGKSALANLSPLRELDSDDVDALLLEIPEDVRINVDASVMPCLSTLTGLEELEVYCRSGRLTDSGIRHISGLRNLKYLRLAGEHLGDGALAHVSALHSLEALDFVGGPTDDGLRHLTELPRLRELAIMVNRLRGPGLAHLAQLPRLEFLRLNGTGLGNRPLHHLTGSTSLRSLTLFGGELGITDAAAPELADMTHLEELRFVWIEGITDAAMVHLKSLRRLRLLDLHSTRVTDAGLTHLTALTEMEDLTLPLRNVSDAGLARVSQLNKLRRLNARGITPVVVTEQGPFTDAGLEHLSRLEHLEDLTICSGAGITDAGIAHLAALRNLKTLSIMAHGITDDGLRILAGMASLENLSVGSHNAATFTVAGVNHLNALANLRYLSLPCVIQDNTGLDLSGMGNLENAMLSIVTAPGRRGQPAFRDEDLAWVAATPKLRWLQVVRGSNLTDAAMAHLADLPCLERLSIGGDRITDRGLACLSGNRSLNHLTLQGRFSDEGVQHLEDLTALRYLSIDSQYELSQPALNRIRQALPNLVFLNAGEPFARGYGGGYDG